MKLAFLSPLLHRPGPWASVYFDTTHATEDAARRQELRARGARDQLAEAGADAATRDALYEALVALEPTDPGRALFATGGEVVLDAPLSAAPPSSSLAYWTALPRIGPLLEYARQEPPCLVAYVDRSGADLQLRRGNETRAAGQVTGRTWPMHRTATADWSERHFQLAVENTWEENAHRIAEALTSDMAQTGAELLVLAGGPRERRAVFDRLPGHLREVTTETDHGGRAAGSASGPLEEDVRAARRDYLRGRAAEALGRFRAGRHPAQGRVEATEGVPALVDAAREHRIAELLVRPGGKDLRREVWVGTEPDQLALGRSEAQYLDEPPPASTRADDALLRCAVATGAEAVPLPVATTDVADVTEGGADGGDEGDGIPAGGLGALLRWPYEQNPQPSGLA